MKRQFALSLVPLVLFGTVCASHIQNASNQSAQVDTGSVRAVSQVYVDILLRTSDTQLFVPYCGEFAHEQLYLCTVGTHLEVYSDRRWRPVRLRTTFGVLGGEDITRVKGKLIAPKSRESFTFRFSRRHFLVEPGQQLRVIVDTWPDEMSMRAGGPSIQLASPHFKCPQIGF